MRISRASQHLHSRWSKGARALTSSFSSSAPLETTGSEGGLWLPFTPNRGFRETKAHRVVSSGSGMYFKTPDGRSILDASAGLWCSAAGMSPRPVVEAVKKQLDEMSYCPSFQVTHEKALEWGEAVVNHGSNRSQGLKHVFFTMCGSTSVDTAMKMALAYHRAKGEGQRTRFIGRERAYHGVGFGGISVGGIPPNRAAFSGCLLPGVDHLPHTHSLAPGVAFSRGPPHDQGAARADALEDIVTLHGAHNIAGVLVEPVAGSAGVLVPPVGYLERLRAICDKHGLLLIFDEVITGFGRLAGAPFASDFFQVTPDIVTTAKGLTGAVVPAGAVLAQGFVYDAITDAAAGENAIEFFHGYTYSAHPVACAAGLAMLKHLEEDGLYAQSAALAPHLEEALHGTFSASAAVLDVRNVGLMGAVTLASPAAWGPPGTFGAKVMDHCWRHEDLYVRVSGDTLAFSPAFVATQEEVYRMVEGAKRAVDAVTLEMGGLP